MLNLQRFRYANETLGRHAGDNILRELGKRIEVCVGRGGLIGHFGADTFAVASPNIADGVDGARVAEHVIAAATDRLFESVTPPVHLAARAGIAIYPADGEQPNDLVQNAEAALREAKRLGQRYQYYAPSMNAEVARTLHLENRLRIALERNEFTLHYQPKVDLGTGKVVGLEALLRWLDPEHGLVSPGQFIPLLEETGLIVGVGQWAMREAAAAATLVRAETGLPIRIAVNVSAVQLHQANFVACVEEAIRSAAVANHGLDLEITESVLMHDIEENVAKLDALRALGVELAIDDFGTGYSSLSYIGRLPVSVIKIDRSFVLGMAKGAAGNAEIVKTIISLTRALDRKTVAEGVETQAQAEMLRRLGCDQYQGYLYSQPVSLEEVLQLLRGNRALRFGSSQGAAIPL